MGVGLIIKLGFFVHDLHLDIEQLHKQQFDSSNDNNSLKVYRRQGVSKIDFEQMQKNKGGLILFNNFLSRPVKITMFFLRHDN
jgi:hypothetical protein